LNLVAAEPKFPPGPCELSEADPFTAAQKCKVLSDAGDPDAMYQFAMMLLMFAPGPGRESQEQMQKWNPLGTLFDSTPLIIAAAEKGSKSAMQLKCNIAADYLAPADLRRDGEKWCAKLKQLRRETLFNSVACSADSLSAPSRSATQQR
jgi:hypothetical protein